MTYIDEGISSRNSINSLSSQSSTSSQSSSDQLPQDINDEDTSSYADKCSELTQAELSSQISNISTLSQDRRYRIERSVTHYENMDKGITRMPQFSKADEFLKCLSQFTMENETLKDLGQFKDDSESNGNNVRYEIIIENQRGATVFGNKMFCKQSVLYPLDPPKYQTLTGQNLVNLSMYPEPAHNWNWSWKKWHVMMINDVDEEGWIYSSVRFGSSNWTGVGKFGNFVRRRIWVRMVERSSPQLIVDDIESIDEDVDERANKNDVKKPYGVIHVLPSFKDAVEQGADAIEKFSDKMKQGLQTDTGIFHQKSDKKVKFIHGTNIIGTSKNNPVKSHDKDDKNRSKPPVTNISQDYDFDSNSDSDDESSIVSFSRDTIGESNLSRQATAFYPTSSPMLSVNEVSEDEIIVQNTFNQVKACSIDRQKISLILESIFDFEDTTIDYLLANYDHSEDKSKTWIYRFILQLHFHDSEIVFIYKFKILLDSAEESTQRKGRIEKLYYIFKDMIDNRSYDSEK